MARRLLFTVACLLLLAAPAAADDIYRKKREIDERLSSVHTKIAHARQQEAVLSQEITLVNARIDDLQNDVAQAQQKLKRLEAELAASQRELDRLGKVFALQTRRLDLLRRDYGVALARLERRVIDAYETPSVDAIDVMFASTSMNDMLSNIEFVQQIGRQDRYVSGRLHEARNAMRAARERTRSTKERVAAETAAIRRRTDEQHAVTAELISTQQQLATARAAKRATLSSVKVNENEFVEEANALEAASSSLAATIQAVQAAPRPSSPETSSSQPSSSGFIWPVSGPISSPFGSRCLGNGDCSLHPGIDIGAPPGTPIKAAASGTVIYAGWLGGYGNLVVIDHGNGLSTAYGHQSSIAAANGASVAQGQVIGYVGCTGYCFGAHLHFEVRVNGQPVDPLGYL